MTDYSKLKLAAEAATPGEWSRDTRKFGGVVYGGPIQHWVNGSGHSQLAMTTGADWMRPGETEANADFIALANPATVLSMIAEIDSLRQNAKRYEFLRSDVSKGKSDLCIVKKYWGMMSSQDVILSMESADHQIDAAMEKEPSNG